MRKYVDTRERVRLLHEKGLSLRQIAEALGLVRSTVAYHLRNLGNPPDPRFNRRYDWAEIQRYYDEGHSITDCQKRFGFSRETWNSARRRGAVMSRPQAMPIGELLAGSSRNRVHIKQRLIRLGLKDDRCENCGISDWMGDPLSLELHHVNGDGKDHRLENLKLLCPNCHSQTETWGGRNRGRPALVEGAANPSGRSARTAP